MEFQFQLASFEFVLVCGVSGLGILRLKASFLGDMAGRITATCLRDGLLGCIIMGGVVQL